MVQAWYNIADQLALESLKIFLNSLLLKMLLRDLRKDIKEKMTIWIEMNRMYRLD